MASSYQVERSIMINAAPSQIYDQIVDLHNWPQWSPWERMDPTMTKSYEGPASGVGSSYSWKGNRKVGEGRMTITKTDAPGMISLDLQFLKPFKSQSTTMFGLDPTGESTEVTWTMTGEHSILTRIMGVFMPMDRLVGKDFEKGLAQLKAVVES
jgi:hypothetical protein